jgi:hypothetical protein
MRCANAIADRSCVLTTFTPSREHVPKVQKSASSGLGIRVLFEEFAVFAIERPRLLEHLARVLKRRSVVSRCERRGYVLNHFWSDSKVRRIGERDLRKRRGPSSWPAGEIAVFGKRTPRSRMSAQKKGCARSKRATRVSKQVARRLPLSATQSVNGNGSPGAGKDRLPGGAVDGGRRGIEPAGSGFGLMHK